VVRPRCAGRVTAGTGVSRLAGPQAAATGPLFVVKCRGLEATRQPPRGGPISLPHRQWSAARPTGIWPPPVKRRTGSFP
jgi:hypothetical protein